jgi:hypothetical protein
VKLIDDLGLRVVDGKVTSVFHFSSEFNFTAANGKITKLRHRSHHRDWHPPC